MEEHKLRAVRHVLRQSDGRLDLGELFAAMENVADELEDAYMGLDAEWRGENRCRFLEMMIADGCFVLRQSDGRLDLGELFAAMENVADELEDAYMGLDAEWRGENRCRFLEMMIADGCFLLEVIRRASKKEFVHGDPVFSEHGIKHMAPFIKRDMLMIENQLPLRVLDTIVALEDPTIMDAQREASINAMVGKFVCSGECDPHGVARAGLARHPLDVYRRSLLKHPARPRRDEVPDGEDSDDDVPRSAQKLTEGGIRFRATRKGSYYLDDIEFHAGSRRLVMPRVVLDDSSAYKYRNVMAFEAMHAGAGNEVTAFVLFVKDLVDSPDDVALLRRKKIISHDLADDDKAVVQLFNELTRDVSKDGRSYLCGVRDEMEKHYRSSWMRPLVYQPWSDLKNTYFRSLWKSIALLAAVLLVATDITQTVYAVMAYQHDIKPDANKNSTSIKW